MKRLVFLLFLFVSTLCVEAQTYYRQFLKDGKVWVCDKANYRIEGDTVINGLSYMKVYRQSKWPDIQPNFEYLGASRETDYEIFMIWANETEEVYLYDYSIKAKEQAVFRSRYLVTVDKGISPYVLGGQSYYYSKVHISDTLASISSKLDCLWIAGIGSNSGPFSYGYNSYYGNEKLQECYEDGKRIISSDDLSQLWFDDIVGSSTFTYLSKPSDGYTVSPIDVTVEHSTTTLEWGVGSYELCKGDRIVCISFRGYNLGPETVRHIKITMNDDYTKEAKTICDSQFKIPHGGSAEEPIVLLKVQLDQTYDLASNAAKKLILECSGEVSDTPLYLETYSGQAFPYISAIIEKKELTGTVVTQDGTPIEGAEVRLYNETYNTLIVIAETDSVGKYSAVVRKNLEMQGTVIAKGCAPYHEQFFWDLESEEQDVVLTNAVHYKTGQQASIILPVKPDPTVARYYKLVRREEGFNGTGIHLIFNRENDPLPNVPYIIFPECDFDISLADYDLDALPDMIFEPLPYDNGELKMAGIYGAYSNKQIFITDDSTSFYNLDEMSLDNCLLNNSDRFFRTPPFRCYIRDKNLSASNFVFVDDASSIDSLKEDKKGLPTLFDLQGRRLNAEPKHGVYIRNGKKVVK